MSLGKSKKEFITVLINLRLFRLYSGICQVLWGVWLLIWTDTFSTSISFDYMASKASQDIWGYGLLCVGVLYLHSLFTPYVWYERICSYGSLGLWLVILGMIIAANPKSPGVAVYSMMCLFCAIEIVRGEKTYVNH